MRVAMGSDHRGDPANRMLADALPAAGHEVIVCGDNNGDPCDYPDLAWQVAQKVARGDAERGILICSNGIGMAIAANKVHGVRAALVCDLAAAEQSRRHNDANVMCLGGEMHSERGLREMVMKWLDTPFDGGRHARRIQKIAAIEAGRDPATVEAQARAG